MADQDPIVGHKTLRDGSGVRHEPLRKSEADALMAQVEAAQLKREHLMPDEASARRMLFDAWLRLKDFGWREAQYCPKNGTEFNAIEVGSTGVHSCTYIGDWPTGSYFISDDCDSYPSRPVLFKPKDHP
jgi:hypothetical protein